MIPLRRFAKKSTRSLCPRQEAVYLLHGFAGNPLLMHRLARHLRRTNYAVRQWGYPSTRRTIAFHASRLRDEIDRVAEADEFERIHFVAHSLGSIIVRQAFHSDHPPIVGRIVMLAPPNAGSHFARAGAAVIGRFCPVLRELSTRPDSYVNQLGPSSLREIGVVAASNDWVVRRRNTHLPTQRDHIVVRGDHVRLPLLRTSADQTLHFLATGSFRHAEIA
jgi:pimeloyl-ACP methyl ester carboxylesterase